LVLDPGEGLIKFKRVWFSGEEKDEILTSVKLKDVIVLRRNAMWFDEKEIRNMGHIM